MNAVMKVSEKKVFIEDNLMNRSVVSEHEILNMLNKIGASLWIDEVTSEYCFRTSKDSGIKRLSEQKLKRVLSSFLECDVTIGVNGNLKPSMLKTVKTVFNTDAVSEFYHIVGISYRTLWKPSALMENNKPGSFKEIMWLLSHLCAGGSENEKRVKWLMNWLAVMFQTRNKSQVALVLTSVQGSGKGMLFEEVIRPLFGEKYTLMIDNERLRSKNRSGISGKLFVFLDELELTKRKHNAVMGFVKQLITNKSVYEEKSSGNAILIEAKTNVLIASNETIPLPIERDDRRFTVYSPKSSLNAAGKVPVKMSANIKNELEAFAHYLSTLEVDMKLYNEAQVTDEKTRIIQLLNGDMNVVYFVDAIRNTDLDYFASLDDERYEQIRRILSSKGNISTCFLEDLYNKLTGSKINARSLLTEMRKVDNQAYDVKNAKKSNKKTYYQPIYA